MTPTLDYLQDIDEVMYYQKQEFERAISSYPPHVEISYCYKCNQPIQYNSISYMEGFHIDC